MSRLFTFGCSFTRYYWPSWADMLGRSYDHFENWGISGTGNRAIVERLSEAIVNSKITKDDTVVVQWTEFHRFDVHLPLPHLPEGWAQGGNMFTSTSVGSSILKLWDERSYMMHTLNYINMAVMMLEHIGCKWFMTSINNLSVETKKHPEFQTYNLVFDHQNWVMPIMELINQYDFPKKTLYDSNNKKNVEDEHPTPLAYYAWLAEKLAPKLNVKIDDDWCNLAEEVLMKKCEYYSLLDDDFQKYLQWSRFYYWKRGVIDSEVKGFG